jgi:hypothetical protein
MSATTALVAAPPEAAAEEVREEEQKVAEAAKERMEQDRTDETEQETTDVSDDDTVVAVESVAEQVPPESRNATEGVPYSAEREKAANRVRQTAALPPGMRERLALLVESGGQVGGEGETLVSLDDAIRAVAESLPNSLRIGGGDVSRPEHPSGDAFFSGRTESEITDQQAEELARGQLARSGLLRGQRVRVAQD